MRHQSPRLRTLLGLLLDRLAQLRDGRVQSIHQLQQIAPPPAGPRSQSECFQLLPSVFPPQSLLAAQSFVERHRLQLIHNARARLHHAVAMPQQLPQIPVPPTRYPDLRETIFQQQTQNQLRVLPIRLLLADAFGPNLCRISDPKFHLQLSQQSFEPARLPTGFHPHTHFLTRQSTVELLRLFAMPQPFFLQLSAVGIHRSNVMKLAWKIYSYTDHVRLLSPEPVGWIQHHQLYSGLGADIVMESISLTIRQCVLWQNLPSLALWQPGELRIRKVVSRSA